ncbi:MAG: hypothetical protein CVT70_04230 [Alphaproteobacteria bacterium HGW-Alphaproteobacteria-1]|nr:MAG: hypothetical protein CVT70_04230 [Alphaproteobacteria bacterium HGW-Alphaproteobacteria-1]
MSGTRSPSPRAHPTEPGRWPVWKLAVLLYPFAAPAVAINLFLAGLIAHKTGFAALPPVLALWLSVPLGVPAAWLCGRWVRGLLDEAAAGPKRAAAKS